MTEEEFNADKVHPEDVKNMDEGEFRVWSFRSVKDLRSKLDGIERRQWYIFFEVIIALLVIIILRILGA